MEQPKAKKPKKKYPLGGMGLRPKEDEKLATMLVVKGHSLKWLQRTLVRMYMAGKIKLDVE